MFVTTYVTNFSNETREIFNEGINLAIENINSFINENNLKFKNFIKINYKENIEKGNNYYFLNILEKRIIDVLYNFCSEKEALINLYLICNDEIFEFLEMNFGEFLLKKGFPFSKEYKDKHSIIIIENNLFPYTPICLDKLNFKKNSIEKIKFKNFPFDKNSKQKFKMNNFSEIPTFYTNNDNIISYEKNVVENYKNIIDNNDNQSLENENDEYSSNQKDEIDLFKEIYS